MMKNIALLLLLVATTVAFAQNYYVISIEGEIYAGDQLLAPKDRLTNEMELRFVGAESSAYLMSPSKGYFVLSAKEGYPPNGKEFLVAVKNALLPPSELKNTAIRALYAADQHIVLEDTYDMLSFFRGRLLYLDTLVFDLDPEYFPEGTTRIEWISTNGTDTLRRDLPVVERKCQLHWPEEFHSATDQWQHQVVAHPWYGEDELSPYTFQLLTPTAAQVQAEMQALRELVKQDTAQDFLLEYALPYVRIRFGKVHPESLRKYL
ncbi:MAG: hypothetical protein AAFZ63_19260 [Bacteroidota bacterium]